MAYHDKAWWQSEDPDRDEDEELPVNCLECGVALDEGEDLLCQGCTDELKSCPFDDDWLESDFDERNGDIDPF